MNIHITFRNGRTWWIGHAEELGTRFGDGVTYLRNTAGEDTCIRTRDILTIKTTPETTP